MAALSETVGKLDQSSGLPLYQQLQRALRHAIESRLLGPDDALPPERDLATEFSVSRITVRKAIDGLVSEGLLVRRQGSGTFVRARVEKNFSKLTSFSEDMRARGRNPRSVWLRRSAGTVTPEESLTLRASPNPFVGRTALRIALREPGTLRVTLLDPTGRLVRHLWAGTVGRDGHALVWDGRDDTGAARPPGIYLIEVEGAGLRLEGRLVKLR